MKLPRNLFYISLTSSKPISEPHSVEITAMNPYMLPANSRSSADTLLENQIKNETVLNRKTFRGHCKGTVMTKYQLKWSSKSKLIFVKRRRLKLKAMISPHQGKIKNDQWRNNLGETASLRTMVSSSNKLFNAAKISATSTFFQYTAVNLEYESV